MRTVKMSYAWDFIFWTSLGSGNYFMKTDKILTSGLVPNGQMGRWGHFPHFPLAKYRSKVNISWLLLLVQNEAVNIFQTLELNNFKHRIENRKIIETLIWSTSLMFFETGTSATWGWDV